MTLIGYEDFEGTDGTALTTSNTVFTNVWGTATPTFETTGAIKNTSSVLFNCTAQTSGCDWAYTARANVWAVWYINFSVLPSAYTAICNFWNGATKLGDVRVDNTGALQLRSQSSAANMAGSYSISTGTTYRLALWVNPDDLTSSGMVLKIYVGDSTTPAATITNVPSTADTQISEHRFGAIASSTYTFLMDDLRLDDATEWQPVAAVPGVATYDRTDTFATDQDDYANATYQIDATGSTGTVTLVQQSGTTATPTESPTGVFTITDPGGTDTLVYLLTAAGTGGGANDTETINISRGAGTAEKPLVYTFQGGDHTNPANWA